MSQQHRPQLTVTDLRVLLRGFPPDASVELEGCDCSAACLGAEMQGERLMLRRMAGQDHVPGDGYGNPDIDEDDEDE